MMAKMTREEWHRLGLKDTDYDWSTAVPKPPYEATEAGWLMAYPGNHVLGRFGSKDRAERMKSELMAFKYLDLA